MPDPAPNTAHILLIVDRSGSMMKIKDDAEGSIESFLNDQRGLTDITGNKIDVTISLAEFDTEFSWLARRTPIDNLDKYRLVPRGGTALLDAIGKGVNEDSDRLKLMSSPPPAKTVCVIVTDGVENASREWSQDGVKKLIQQCKDEFDWQFEFLATDITTIDMGRDMGMQTTQFAATSAGTQSAYNTTSRSVSSYFSGASTRVDNPETIQER